MIIFFSGSVIHSTYYEHEPPIEWRNTTAFIKKADTEHSFLTYSREVLVKETILTKVTLELSKSPEGVPIFQLPSVEYLYEDTEGEWIEIIRTIELPAYLQSGLWCLQGTLHWRPKLSLSDHSVKLESVCADLKGKIK